MFYKRSHLQALKPKPAANGFLEVPPENITHDSIERVEVEMETGGLYDLSCSIHNASMLTCYRTIIDARLGFTIIQGLAINFGFGTQEELKKWAPMRLPDLRNLRDIVASMRSETIGNSFQFVGISESL